MATTATYAPAASARLGLIVRDNVARPTIFDDTLGAAQPRAPQAPAVGQRGATAHRSVAVSLRASQRAGASLYPAPRKPGTVLPALDPSAYNSPRRPHGISKTLTSTRCDTMVAGRERKNESLWDESRMRSKAQLQDMVIPERFLPAEARKAQQKRLLLAKLQLKVENRVFGFNEVEDEDETPFPTYHPLPVADREEGPRPAVRWASAARDRPAFR